jgi:hypothetical protein
MGKERQNTNTNTNTNCQSNGRQQKNLKEKRKKLPVNFFIECFSHETQGGEKNACHLKFAILKKLIKKDTIVHIIKKAEISNPKSEESGLTLILAFTLIFLRVKCM